MVILGIDPGYAIVGYGAVEVDKGRMRALGYGAITTPAGVPLLPVQLWEAGAEGVIFLFLLWYSRRVSRPAVLLRAYVFAYAPVRFVLEFLRGDAARGNLGPLSTSQWIGLAALCACLIWQMLERRECGRDKA